MLGDSSSVLATTTTAPDGGIGGGGGNNGEAPPPSAPRTHLLPPGGGGAHESTSEAGHVGSNNNSGEEDKGRGGGDEGDRSFGGNRWPRQETLALLKIRSDMDVAFRDASVKGPLWEEVSRKLAELGYNRSAKKCKEKFENVYKYHKRTKEGRSGKQEGKTYRFFDQLEAFENHPPPSFSSPPPPQPQPQQQQPPIITTIAMPSPPISHISTTVPSTTAKHVADHHQRIITTGINLTIPSSTNPTISSQEKNPTNVSFSAELVSNSTSSSSTSSDVEIQGRRKKKRKWKDFFERLMKEVIHKQEDMQKKFLEAIEKREHDRMIREESWRMQEMARINREREILAQERSMSAAKDAAVMAFLQKLSEQQNPIGQHNNPPPTQPQPPPVQAVATPPPPPPAAAAGPPQPAPAPAPEPEPAPAPQPQQAVAVTNLETKTDNNGDRGFNLLSGGSSSRWPKVEVQALINLRTNLDSKYQDNGPKGPLWEEISAGMRKLGYNRSAKRCKEKWENINKYFKKVKESNKKRPEDSKTCPYFHQLDALYKEKNANIHFKPENSVPLMVQPEQQWPPPAPPPPPLNSSSHHQHPQESVMEDLESDQDHQSHQDEDDKDNDDDDDDDDEASGYEIVANRPTSISSAG